MSRNVNLDLLLERVSPQWEEVIREAKNSLRQGLGMSIQNVMRLSMKAANPPSSVQVDIAPGYPRVLEQLDIGAWNTQAEHLIVFRKEMECYLQDGGRILEGIQTLPELDQSQSGVRNAWVKSLGESKAIVERLLRFSVSKSVLKRILEVDEDILGTYSFEDGKGRVRLYWAVIAFVANSLGVDATDLAMVVLTHELAHAFTHLGGDADGNTWLDFFVRSDRKVLEALAQYYTHSVLFGINLKGRENGIRHAYETLTPLQPETYQRHLGWINRWQPEAVRAAMLELRNGGVADLEGFEACIESHSERLRVEGLF